MSRVPDSLSGQLRLVAESPGSGACGGARYRKAKQLVAEVSALSTCVNESRSAWCGVYFLFRGSTLVYVGKSVNFPARLRQHLSEAVKNFNAWSFLPVPEKDLTATESALIALLRPPLNNSPHVRWHRPKAFPPAHWAPKSAQPQEALTLV